MRLVNNPSYVHSPEIKNKFNQYKDMIFMKDHSQYTPGMMEALLFSIIESKKIGMKKDHILWLTKQLWDDGVNSKSRAEEDYIPLVKMHFANKNSIEPINNYRNISELNKIANNMSRDDISSEEDYDIFYESEGWFVAMPHTTQASCDLGKDTSWCTARTKSQNLFLSYVARHWEDVVLFYVIKISGNPKNNPNDKLSVGFINGVPVFDGKSGGLSVNAINKGITLEQFGEILGNELAQEFLVKMDEKAQSIKGKHPAKKEMEKIAKSVDRFLEKLSEFKDEEHLVDFKKEILKYPISEGIQLVLAQDENEEIKRSLPLSTKLSEKVQLILAKGSSIKVRTHLAFNDFLTEKTQLVLARDSSKQVRKSLTFNVNLTEKAQLILAKDSSEFVRKYLASTSINKEIVNLILTEDTRLIRENLAYNDSLTEKIQLILAKDTEISVRKKLAKNKTITDKVRLILMNDISEVVRKALPKNKPVKRELKFLSKVYEI